MSASACVVCGKPAVTRCWRRGCAARIHHKCYGSHRLAPHEEKAKSLRGSGVKSRAERPVNLWVALSLRDAEAMVSILLALELDVVTYDLLVDILYD